jgi:hypothetical protein
MPKASRRLTLAPGAALSVNRGSTTTSAPAWSVERLLDGDSSEPFFSNQSSFSKSSGRSGNSESLNEFTPSGRFWTNSDVLSEDDEGDEIKTPTKEELIESAAHAGCSAQDLAQAEKEITEMEQVSFSSPASADFRCPISSKIIKAIIRGKSLRTLGDAVVKNSYIRL